MMDWADGTEERRDFNTVTSGSRNDLWFRENRERIRAAAMGKGAPQDYELALEWAVRSGKIAHLSQATVQAYLDDHLGIDCSGFVTNYLIACGKKTYSLDTVGNTSAASYYNGTKVNDPSQIRQGDLLVWMNGNAVKTSPGHVAVVESYTPQSMIGGNMRVVEATGASGANPNAASPDGTTAVMWAASNGDLDLVRALIKAGANVKLANQFGTSAITEASILGSAPIIDALLKAGADANYKTPDGETPIMAAAR